MTRITGALLLALVLSLLGNAWQFLRAIPVRAGEGSHKASPDATLNANAMTTTEMNWLHPDYGRIFGTLFVDRGDQRIFTMTIDPPGVDSEMGYRELDNPIAWDRNSAKFDLPHVVVSITLKDEAR